MKKVLVILVVAFTTIASASALNLNEYKVFYKLNNKTTFASLNRYLKLDENQKKNLKTEFLVTEEKVSDAIEAGSKVKAEEAMNSNLASLKKILSNEQYEKFVLALNVTIENNRDNQLLAAD